MFRSLAALFKSPTLICRRQWASRPPLRTRDSADNALFRRIASMDGMRLACRRSSDAPHLRALRILGRQSPYRVRETAVDACFRPPRHQFETRRGKMVAFTDDQMAIPRFGEADARTPGAITGTAAPTMQYRSHPVSGPRLGKTGVFQ